MLQQCLVMSWKLSLMILLLRQAFLEEAEEVQAHYDKTMFPEEQLSQRGCQKMHQVSLLFASHLSMHPLEEMILKSEHKQELCGQLIQRESMLTLRYLDIKQSKDMPANNFR